MKPHGFTSPQPIHQAEALPVLHLARLGICWFLRASALFSIHPSCRQLQAGLLSGRAHGVRWMNETDDGIHGKHVSSVNPVCWLSILPTCPSSPSRKLIAGGPTRLGVKWVKVTRRGERAVLEQSCSTGSEDGTQNLSKTCSISYLLVVLLGPSCLSPFGQAVGNFSTTNKRHLLPNSNRAAF